MAQRRYAGPHARAQVLAPPTRPRREEALSAVGPNDSPAVPPARDPASAPASVKRQPEGLTACIPCDGTVACRVLLRAKSASKGEATASGDAGVPGEVAGFGG